MCTGKPLPLREQIAFIRRELFRRNLEYAAKSRRGHMAKTEVEHRIACMDAVLNTLLALEKRAGEFKS